MTAQELKQLNDAMINLINSNRCKCVSVYERNKIKRVVNDKK